MQSVKKIQQLNQRELELGIPPSASWHRDYTSAYIYIGGLPYELSEGDVVTIFSQFGEPVFINLVRDKESGKSKGFAFLKYEDQRSTDLAVDNLSGAVVMGRTLRVDHADYNHKEDEEKGDNTYGDKSGENGASNSIDHGEGGRKKQKLESDSEDDRPVLPEERELAKVLKDMDEEDPMREYMVQKHREKVDKAIRKWKKEHRRERRAADKASHESRKRVEHHSRKSRSVTPPTKHDRLPERAREKRPHTRRYSRSPPRHEARSSRDRSDDSPHRSRRDVSRSPARHNYSERRARERRSSRELSRTPSVERHRERRRKRDR